MSTHAAVVANDIRMASISITIYEYIITLPSEYRFYRAFYRNNFRLTASLVLFVLNRYLNIIGPALGNWQFYSHKFTVESCHKLFLLPTVFRVLLGMVSQMIIGLRAYTISRKNRTVGIVLLSAYSFSTVVQWFAQIYKRAPVLVDGTCGAAALQPTLFLSSWLFYLSGMFYDLLTLIISMSYLFKLNSTSPFTARLVRMMIYDGLGYFVVLTVANTVNAIMYRSTNSILQVAGAPLSGLVTWIMSQRILIHLRDASEKWGLPEPSSYVHRTTRTRSSGTKDTSARDHYDDVKQQEGTELAGVRIDRSVIVGVGPWNSEPSNETDEPCRKPEVKWDQRL